MNQAHYQEEQDAFFARADRFDGFDRGDLGRADICDVDIGQRVIGRMTNGGGYRVEIVELWCDDLIDFDVRVDGSRVHRTDEHAQAVTVARWWMAGCSV